MRVHSQTSHKTEILNIILKSTIPITTRVAIGNGALGSVGNVLSQSNSGQRVLVLGQEGIPANLSLEVIQSLSHSGFQTEFMELPAGEACKNHDQLINVWQKLQEMQCTRSDALVAVGGGALTDLAGFAASTYLRGIKLVLVPTTLLAQVDAAIGGKTGINLPSGKNLAGSFYFPTGVVVDPLILQTLPEREIKSGLGEIIKYAAIELTVCGDSEYRAGPRSLLAVLEDLIIKDGFTLDNPAIPGIVGACVRMKLAVVGKDPLEGRLRRCLNLGHTLGHAVEKVSQFAISHGEAVAIGLVFACRLAVHRGVFLQAELDRLMRLLVAAGLPVEIPGELPTEKLVQAMAFDKKRAGEGIKFVLPVKPLGQVDLDSSLTLPELKAFLAP